MVLDYFDSHGNIIPMPPTTNHVAGNVGYVAYLDSEYRERGKITIAVETFEQLKAYMDYLTGSSRFEQVSWFPAAVPIAPPKEN